MLLHMYSALTARLHETSFYFGPAGNNRKKNRKWSRYDFWSAEKKQTISPNVCKGQKRLTAIWQQASGIFDSISVPCSRSVSWNAPLICTITWFPHCKCSRSRNKITSNNRAQATRARHNVTARAHFFFFFLKHFVAGAGKAANIRLLNFCRRRERI